MNPLDLYLRKQPEEASPFDGGLLREMGLAPEPGDGVKVPETPAQETESQQRPLDKIADDYDKALAQRQAQTGMPAKPQVPAGPPPQLDRSGVDAVRESVQRSRENTPFASAVAALQAPYRHGDKIHGIVQNPGLTPYVKQNELEAQQPLAEFQQTRAARTDLANEQAARAMGGLAGLDASGFGDSKDALSSVSKYAEMVDAAKARAQQGEQARDDRRALALMQMLNSNEQKGLDRDSREMLARAIFGQKEGFHADQVANQQRQDEDRDEARNQGIANRFVSSGKTALPIDDAKTATQVLADIRAGKAVPGVNWAQRSANGLASKYPALGSILPGALLSLDEDKVQAAKNLASLRRIAQAYVYSQTGAASGVPEQLRLLANTGQLPGIDDKQFAAMFAPALEHALRSEKTRQSVLGPEGSRARQLVQEGGGDVTPGPELDALLDQVHPGWRGPTVGTSSEPPVKGGTSTPVREPGSKGDGKVTVSNGKETLRIDPSDLAAAEKDGYKQVSK